MGSTVLETLVVKIVGDAKEYIATIKESTKWAKQFAKGMNLQLKHVGETVKKVGAQIKKLGSDVKKVGMSLTKNLTLPIVALGGAALKFSIDFNKSLANIASLGIGGERLSQMKNDIRKIAVETAKSTDDIADGLYQVVSAFGDSADSAEILRINAKAGAAGLATTVDAINLTSSVTKGYGDTTARAVQKVSDLAFMAVKLGQTDFPQLAASMGKVVPLSTELNVSQEELFTTFATLTGVTGKAAEVATQYRGILQALMVPSKAMTQLLQDQGFVTGKSMLKSLGLMGTIKAITKAQEQSGKPLANYIGSIEGQTAALALSGSQSEVYLEKLEQMQEAAGATDAAFKAQTEGVNKLGVDLKKLWVETTIVAQKFGEALAPALGKVLDAIRPLVDWVKKFADWVSGLDPRLQTIITTVLLLTASIGPLVVAIGSIGAWGGLAVNGLGTLITLMGGTTAASAILTNSLVALKFAAAGVAVYLTIEFAKALYNSNQDIIAYNKAVEEAIQLNKDFVNRTQSKTQSILGEAEELQGKDRNQFLTAELKKAEGLQKGHVKTISNINKKGRDELGRWNIFASNMAIKELVRQENHTKKLMVATEERIALLKKELGDPKSKTEKSHKRKKWVWDNRNKMYIPVSSIVKSKTLTPKEETKEPEIVKTFKEEKSILKKQIIEARRVAAIRKKIMEEVEAEMNPGVKARKEADAQAEADKKLRNEGIKKAKADAQGELDRSDNRVDLRIGIGEVIESAASGSAEARQRIAEFAAAQQDRIGIERDRAGKIGMNDPIVKSAIEITSIQDKKKAQEAKAEAQMDELIALQQDTLTLWADGITEI